MPTIKNFSLSFYFVYYEAETLELFNKFLVKWAKKKYDIQSGKQLPPRQEAPFQVHFTITIKAFNDSISPKKVCELLKFIADGGVEGGVDDKEMKINNVVLGALNS